MATNDFLPFAGGAGANALDQADYEALTALSAGFTSGVAPSAACNKVWRQATIMASVVAQLIVDNTGQDAIDDGTTSTLLGNLKAATAGRLINVQTFTASGTYTPTPGTNSVVVEVLGGGGGGGGSPVTDATHVGIGGPGNAGAYGVSRITSGFSGATVTVGAAGAAGTSGSAGGSGGASSFGAFVSAPGGAGGAAGTSTSPPVAGNPSTAVIATGANIVNAPGATGLPGIMANGGVGIAPSGASSKYGAGGCGASVNATGHGAGGSGVISGYSTVSAQSGGAGTGGLVIVWEYA